MGWGGGVAGAIGMMKNQELLDFLAVKSKTAGYVTSVYTGSPFAFF